MDTGLSYAQVIGTDLVISQKYDLTPFGLGGATGEDVVGATVTGTWSGAVSEPDSGVTGADGKVMLESSRVNGGGTYTFTVTDVVKSGYTYNSGLNVETSDTITVP